MLKFIGTGSAFNTELGNNGAYIKEGNELFMIDCGSSTFARMMEINLLDGVEKIYVLSTHTHSDHIGSLGDLILYGYYSLGEFAKPFVTVLSPFDLNIRDILKSVGVDEDTYVLSRIEQELKYLYSMDLSFLPIPVKHVKNLNCYGYLIEYDNTKIYYSGDCYEIPKGVVDMLDRGRIDYFYQDTCKADYEGNVHLSLRKLNELIPYHVRDRVYCMHLDSGFSKEEARGLGFNVVESEGI